MREFYRGGGESERRIGRRIFKGLFVNAPRIEDAIYFSRRESLSNARRARPGFLRIVERFDGAAMIFPIQPPLMERDDKAATVIIAVVYGARRFRVCVWVWVCVCMYVCVAGSCIELFSLSPSPSFSHCSSFLFLPCLDFAGANENIFVVSQIRSGDDVPMTRNDLLTTVT